MAYVSGNGSSGVNRMLLESIERLLVIKNKSQVKLIGPACSFAYMVPLVPVGCVPERWVYEHVKVPISTCISLGQNRMPDAKRRGIQNE